MRRLIPIAVLLGAASGCYVGRTDSEIQITGVRAPQTDPTKDTCDQQLPGVYASETSTADLQAGAAGGFPLSLLRTLDVSSQVQHFPIGFVDQDLSAHEGDFRVNRQAFTYESNAVQLADETFPMFFVIPENSTGGCLKTLVMGTNAMATLSTVVVTSPIVVTAHIRLEGEFVNGKAENSNTVDYPITLLP